MTRCIVAALLVAAAAPAQDLARMDQVVQSYVTNKTFMGSVLVARGDQILLSKGYGSANIVHRGPHPAAGRTRQAENGRPGEQVHARRTRSVGQNHHL
jgi:CubicO group peptidase (beta-lactamase class C family)